MAKPIAPTPILKGKEADKFIENLDSSEHKIASKEEVLRAKRIYEIVRATTESTYAL